MKAPQYLVNNIDLARYNKYKMGLHLTKLKGIQDRKSIILSSTPSPIKYPSKKYVHDRKK